MTDFVNGLTLKRGDAASPEVFTAVTGMISMSGFGTTNSLVKVTDFDSSAEEYIGGLADGSEVSMEFNHNVTASTEYLGLIDDVNSQVERNFEMVITDGSATHTYSFTLAMLSWTINPSYDDRNTATITGKLTGAISRADT